MGEKNWESGAVKLEGDAGRGGSTQEMGDGREKRLGKKKKGSDDDSLEKKGRRISINLATRTDVGATHANTPISPGKKKKTSRALLTGGGAAPTLLQDLSQEKKLEKKTVPHHSLNLEGRERER